MKRENKTISCFLASCFALLVISGVAKCVSAFGHSQILQTADPVFSVPFRHLLLVAGIVELLVASAICKCKNLLHVLWLLAWLSTSIFLYRISLFFVGYEKPCPCLGNLTDMLQIPPQTADTAMKIILAYLLIGTYASLLWLWRQRKKAVSSTVDAASF